MFVPVDSRQGICCVGMREDCPVHDRKYNHSALCWHDSIHFVRYSLDWCSLMRQWKEHLAPSTLPALTGTILSGLCFIVRDDDDDDPKVSFMGKVEHNHHNMIMMMAMAMVFKWI